MSPTYRPFRRCVLFQFAPVITEKNNIGVMPPGPYKIVDEWFEWPEHQEVSNDRDHH